jgi:hypothetical protein
MPYQPPGLKGQLVVVDLNLSWDRILLPASKVSALLDLMANAVQVTTGYVGGGREVVECKGPPYVTGATVVPERYTLVPHTEAKEFKAMYEAAAQITPPLDGVEAVTYEQFRAAVRERAAKEASS